MPSGFPRPAPLRLLSILALASSLLLAGCNDDSWPARTPAVITDADADSLVFWPPRAYALANDFLTVEVHGLKRVYACSRLLSFSWTLADSAGATWLGIHSSIELPAAPDCGFSTGLDTALDTTAPAAGRMFYLRTPGGKRTDSLFTFAGSGVVTGFLHPRSATDTLSRHGHFTFRDSTAGHPRRVLYADSLEACEVIQAAVFRRLHDGDTLSIYYRSLLAVPALSPDILPACAGIHSDTIPVVLNRYQYP